MRGYIYSVLLLYLSVSPALAVDEDKIKPLPLISDALALAAADLATIPLHERRYVRYLWEPEGEQEAMQVDSLTVNQVSTGVAIVRPLPLKRGPVLVLRLDARHYAPRQDDRIDEVARWLNTWEELRFDPRLNIFLTGDALRLAAQHQPDLQVRARKPKWAVVPCPLFVQDGKTYTARWQLQGYEDTVLAAADVKDVVVVTLTSPDVDPTLYNALVAGTGSQAPLVSADYFRYRATATIQDRANALWFTVLGGLYYDLSGIRQGTNAKQGSDFDNLLARLGVGDVSRGIGYRQVFEALRSDQKVLLFHSGVTNGPREVDIIPMLGGSVETQRLIRITNDLKRANVDVGVHPAMNLFGNKFDAHEVFFGLANGLQGGALFDGAGKLQDEAPPDIARDWTVPPPAHDRLQGYIGCASCHDAEGSDNYKRLSNDAPKLLKQLDVLGDLTRYGRSYADLQDRLRSYRGNPEAAYTRGRDDYAAAVLQATGPWKRSGKGQVDVVKIAATKQVELWRRYDGTVDPQQALRELGLDVPKGKVLEVLNRLLPPDAASATYLGLPEDARIGGLKAGISLTRADWSLVRGFVAGRAGRTLTDLQQRAKTDR